jgi:hypothetical protein
MSTLLVCFAKKQEAPKGGYDQLLEPLSKIP